MNLEIHKNIYQFGKFKKTKYTWGNSSQIGFKSFDFTEDRIDPQFICLFRASGSHETLRHKMYSECPRVKSLLMQSTALFVKIS